MIKRILLAAACLAVMHGVDAQKPKKETPFHLKVTVHGLPKDSLCYLAYYFCDKQYIIDSTSADVSSSVVFKADTLMPRGIYLFVLPDKTYFELILDREQRFSMQTDRSDLINRMTIEGSLGNQVFYEYLVFINAKSQKMNGLKLKMEGTEEGSAARQAVQKEMEGLNAEVIARKEKFIAEHPGMLMTSVFIASKDVDMPKEQPRKADGTVDSTAVFYYYRDHFFDHIDLTDNRLIRTPVLYPKIEQWIKKLTPQIPDSINAAADLVIEKSRSSPDIFKFLVWWITNQYETSNIMGMDAVFVHMARKYYTKDQAFWADSTTLYRISERANVLEPILIGKPMRRMLLKDTSGVYRSLYDVKSEYTILLIWDPDCGHCKKAVPRVKQLYDLVKPHGVEVYAVNNESEADKWKKFIREHHLNWINVADLEVKNNFRYELDIKTTPQLFLLDAEKKIVAKKIDANTLAKMLEEKLGVKIDLPAEKDDQARHGTDEGDDPQ